MTGRAGVTLLEVLITIFVMAIGLLAVLTLFPLGALSMAQALQSDRAATAAGLAAEYAEAMDLRHDPNVIRAFTTAPPHGTDLPDDHPSPSWPVFVDGFGALANPGPIGVARPASPGISRVRPAYVTTYPLAARWFSLLDDLTFAPDATPAGGLVQRGGRYTWAYLLRRPRVSSPAVVDLSVIVYSGRDTTARTGESPYRAGGSKGDASLTLYYTVAQGKPALRRNAWLLDATLDPTTGVTRGNCYRVVNVAESGSQSLSLEIEGLLEDDVGIVVVLDNAIEVLKMGSGRKP
jgi:prepilin-type N-terminal cleavage/methylation domain-containing protein